jgi:hypothetical protein
MLTFRGIRVENKEVVLTIPVPTESIVVGTATLSNSQRFAFKEQIDEHIRRSAILQENMQKACSLILGQCAELLMAKLKQSRQRVMLVAVQTMRTHARCTRLQPGT